MIKILTILAVLLLNACAGPSYMTTPTSDRTVLKCRQEAMRVENSQANAALAVFAARDAYVLCMAVGG